MALSFQVPKLYQHIEEGGAKERSMTIGWGIKREGKEYGREEERK
jgi:hypothetical protein